MSAQFTTSQYLTLAFSASGFLIATRCCAGSLGVCCGMLSVNKDLDCLTDPFQLTASQVLPAIIQKAQGTLTLYHACIVTNYTVMSVVTSLAIAPMVPIWRNNSLAVDQTKKLTEKAKKIEREFSRQKQVEGERGRLVLALAILIQV